MLIGRDAELDTLTTAWDAARRGDAKKTNVLTFVALGGEGKTALVAKWAVERQVEQWPGCEAAFAWSFYSQGSRDQAAVSSDLFLKEALTFFGDADMANSPQGAFEKGKRLARLIGEKRALLFLDGLEPLQYPPSSPMAGQLKDQGVSALLKGLAGTNRGLCIVTTRYAITDLRAYKQTTAPMRDLLRLSTAAGVGLLRSIGVKIGSPAEFAEMVEDVDGHALTLQILGQFLVRAFHGDIRLRDRIDLQKADVKIQGGHAFRAMAAYVKWLENDSDESRREVAILSLLGLFDRPATAECVAALRQAPVIVGLTESLVGLAEDDWEFSLTALQRAKLLTVNREGGSGELIALDAHPLLREYFAVRVREQQPEAWRAAHRRVYEHLCKTTSDRKPSPTLEDLEPLYQAVAHGCQAGMHAAAHTQVYRHRIRKGNEHYTTKKLGAWGAELGAAACFFETPWNRVSPALTEADQALLLNQAAQILQSLGRLTEAVEPLRAGLEMCVRQNDWLNAAISASNLGLFEVTTGEVARAVTDAGQAVTYADLSGNAFQRISKRASHANALHQAGRRAEAGLRFHEAEEIQAKNMPKNPILSSAQGFLFCDLLLAEAERAAGKGEKGSNNVEWLAACRTVSDRTVQTLKIAELNNWLLDIAFDHLTQGRSALYAAVLSPGPTPSSHPAELHLEQAVSGLRRAGHQYFIPLGLLTRAWLRSITGPRTGPDSAQEDLDEAWEIAERGPMPLHLADIHLYRARLFMRDTAYPWESPRHDLAECRRLVEKHGYGRRLEELADAEDALRQATTHRHP